VDRLRDQNDDCGVIPNASMNASRTIPNAVSVMNFILTIATSPSPTEKAPPSKKKTCAPTATLEAAESADFYTCVDVLCYDNRNDCDIMSIARRMPELQPTMTTTRTTMTRHDDNESIEDAEAKASTKTAAPQRMKRLLKNRRKRIGRMDAPFFLIRIAPEEQSPYSKSPAGRQHSAIVRIEIHPNKILHHLLVVTQIYI
jgi:hypothetical protein